ncbi:MAG: L-threonylcarbamoyladenylate synthase [Nitrososphaeria archaeon]|nr:L-threonylcarbamoyladenylate synthase [Conexivisphaerales archaeon]
MSLIIRVDPVNFKPEDLFPAAEAVKSGKTVAFPTETVYGLGADAFNGEACLKIFKIKNRQPDNPLIVHINSFEQLYSVAREVILEDKLKRVWPGPLTVILKKRPEVPVEVTAGLDTVAVRMPAHLVALKLIELSGTPIAAPSANISGRPSPTSGKTVIEELNGRADVIIDAGDTFFGVESTIVDLTKQPPTLLRPGPFTIDELTSIFGKIEVPPEATGISDFERPLAPGMKYRHYAPEKDLYLLVDNSLLPELVRRIDRKVAFLLTEENYMKVKDLARDNVTFIILGTEYNLYTVARNLFESLRKIDRLDVEFAVIQSFKEEGIGLAIMNRIRKASGRKFIRFYPF